METGSGADQFLTTRWSIVRAAGGQDKTLARAALASLCQSYWYPLYAFVRRKGVAAQDAEDVVQGFFAQVLANDNFLRVAPEKGRFRSYLLVCAQNHLANLRDGEKAQKRGEGRAALDIDFSSADTRFGLEATVEDPNRAFERAWALALLERALVGLEQEYRASDRGALFDVLKPELTGGTGAGYASYAARLDSNEAAIKVAVHRLRKRYRERLRAEIAQTVADESEIEAEIRDLFAALGP
ncbi:MAG TPA: sigma-70 family RNA polymerase sigma factor [Planctomycetota bacterium]|nr:sigma-70 family RNA polymerase sigma factor [Planctomycetota bacterium]